MSEQDALELKQALSPAPEKEEETVSNTESPKLGEDESKKTGDTEPDAVDYKALYEAEEARRIRAEEKIVKEKKKQKVKEDPEDEIDDEEDKEELIARIVEQKLSGIETKVRSEFMASEVENIISEMSSNLDERALIKHIYENRLQKTGSTIADIREDLQSAKLLANRDSIIASNKEMAQSLKSKATVQTTPISTSSVREVPSEERQLNDREKKLLEVFGVKTN